MQSLSCPVLSSILNICSAQLSEEKLRILCLSLSPIPLCFISLMLSYSLLSSPLLHLSDSHHPTPYSQRMIGGRGEGSEPPFLHHHNQCCLEGGRVSASRCPLVQRPCCAVRGGTACNVLYYTTLQCALLSLFMSLRLCSSLCLDGF
jgi:hypothetical protein